MERKLPRTATAAKKRGYKVVKKIDAGKIKSWKSYSFDDVRVAPARVRGYHYVCYYDPNTGNYDNCVLVPDNEVPISYLQVPPDYKPPKGNKPPEENKGKRGGR